MVPSEDQKRTLIAQLDSMPRDQWTALVRWMIDRIVADDQSMAVTILFSEAQRRMEKANEFQAEERSKRKVDDCLAEVLREVGVKLALA